MQRIQSVIGLYNRYCWEEPITAQRAERLKRTWSSSSYCQTQFAPGLRRLVGVEKLQEEELTNWLCAFVSLVHQNDDSYQWSSMWGKSLDLRRIFVKLTLYFRRVRADVRHEWESHTHDGPGKFACHERTCRDHRSDVKFASFRDTPDTR